MILILFVSVKIMFTITPDHEIPSNTTTKGAIFTTIGWILVVQLYSYWVSNFANYDIFYGSLSNIVVMMLMTYIISYGLIELQI